MTIQQTTTTSFRVELFEAIHNFGPTSPDTFMIALYTGASAIGASTMAYSTLNEVIGTGYTAGGNILTINQYPTWGSDSSVDQIPTAYVSFANTAWAGASFTARGALIYNASKANRSVAVLDFGADKTVSNQTFTVQFPAANANSAIVRIA
jgi:hypothetical protein